MSFHCAAVLATEAAALDSGIAWAERAGGGPGAGAPQQGAQPMKLKHLEAMLGDVALTRFTCNRKRNGLRSSSILKQKIAML